MRKPKGPLDNAAPLTAAAQTKQLGQEVPSVPEGEALAAVAPETKQVTAEAYKDAVTTLAARVGNYAARRALFKTPGNLEGAEAEEYGNRRRVALLPFAWEIIERSMKLGGVTKEEMEAARLVIEANGQARQEARTSTGPTINLNLSGPLPWAAANATVTVEPSRATQPSKPLPPPATFLKSGNNG